MSQQYMPPQPVEPKPAKGKRRWPWIVAVPVAFFIGVGVGGVGGDTTPVASTLQPTIREPGPTVTVTAPPAPAVTVTAKPAAAPKPKAKPKPKAAATFPGDGTYVVGADIKAGTYRSKPGPDGLGMCIWQRLSDTSGELDAVIAGDISQGPVTVTIKSGDEAFQTNGCDTWERVE